jgi:hypothetical protein
MPSWYTDKLRKRRNKFSAFRSFSQKKTMPKKRRVLEDSEEEPEEPTWQLEYIVGGPKYFKGVPHWKCKWLGYSEPTWQNEPDLMEDLGGKAALDKMVEDGKNMLWETAVDECGGSDSNDTDDEPVRKRVKREVSV